MFGYTQKIFSEEINYIFPTCFLSSEKSVYNIIRDLEAVLENKESYIYVIF